MTTIHIAGHIGKNPESRVTPKGQKVTTFNVATNVYQGPGKEDTIWWRVTVWGDDHKNIMDHLKQGTAVMVVGEMRSKPEIYTNQAGQQGVSLNITAISIRFSPFGRSNGEQSQNQGQSQRPNTNQYQANQFSAENKNRESPYAQANNSFGGGQYDAAQDDDEIPF